MTAGPAFAAVDGDVAPLDAVTVPVDDRGFLLGDAVFETLRTYGGRLFDLQAHLDRLEASAAGIHLVLPERARLAAFARAPLLVARGAHPGREWLVRVTATRGRGGHGLSPKGAGPTRCYTIARALAMPDESPRVALCAITAKTRRADAAVLDPRWKVASALPLVLARMEADAAGVDEALLLDARGRYVEATTANLFVCSGDRVVSPGAADGALEGVTARHVRRLLSADGVAVEGGAVPAASLRAATEVILTQTSREVLSVVEIDGRPVGTGLPGPMAQRARALFQKEVPRWLDPE